MADLTDIGCCSCFSFLRKSSVPVRQHQDANGMLSEDLLKRQSAELPDGSFYTGNDPDISFYNGDDLDRSFYNGDDPDRSFYDRDDTHYLEGSDDGPPIKSSEDIIQSRTLNGFICREIPVKETKKIFRSEDENGNKMVNQYVHLGKIGSGSYGKVVLYRNIKDGKLYAVKVLNKPYMMKVRVVRTETAMTDVLREVSIMKMLNHPNIVNLVEVIDDPNIDKFYMVLEYVEGKMVCDNGLEEATARNYLRDIISGLMYLHSHNVIHGDIKPDNLLVTSAGNVKIGDFSVSQVFEDDDDMLWRSPGTPVFTAPECCQGSAYHGRASDTWAVGVTLYCMVSGHYPFLGDTLQETYDKIANDPVQIPGDMNPQLADLLLRLLCKDPGDRITLQAAAEHPWVAGIEGPVPEFICRCGFGRRKRNDVREEVQ
ncbi:serine/threonine-protein kinase GRIK1-like [Miscanthus floridulus]|uniref:serine/threonine-protein kinase GRIK1-like n=1 Tax=Miscanthus floridulus TaxID=154761 RepID=UPI0034592A84